MSVWLPLNYSRLIKYDVIEPIYDTYIVAEASGLNKQLLKKIIKQTIEEYNKYRTHEVTARLILIESSNCKIDFTGHFCFTCGVYDYFDDFRFLLEESNVKAKITEIEEIDEGAIVTFTLES